MLFGISIIMNQIGKEHGKAHVHAIYGDQRGVFLIENGEMIEGNLKQKQQQIVKRFIKTYQHELQSMWDNKNIKKLKI